MGGMAQKLRAYIAKAERADGTRPEMIVLPSRDLWTGLFREDPDFELKLWRYPLPSGAYLEFGAFDGIPVLFDSASPEKQLYLFMPAQAQMWLLQHPEISYRELRAAIGAPAPLAPEGVPMPQAPAQPAPQDDGDAVSAHITDEFRDGPCPGCSAEFRQRRIIMGRGGVRWHIRTHAGPCGLPCAGGALSRRYLENPKLPRHTGAGTCAECNAGKAGV